MTFTKGDLAEATAGCVEIVKEDIRTSKRGVKYVRDAKWILEKAPANLKHALDHDYLDKLSPAELQWIAEFDDAYYTGKKNSVSKDWSIAKMREAYTRNNCRLRCFYQKRWPCSFEVEGEFDEDI